MSAEHNLLGIRYEFGAGPLSFLDLMYLYQPPEQINCQAALQLFTYFVRGQLMLPYEALSQEGYQSLGRPIKLFEGSQFFAGLEFGDIIYAKRRKRETVLIGYTPEQQLHVSVYLGLASSLAVRTYFPTSSLQFEEKDHLIYHATVIGKKSTLWTVETFFNHYKPLIAKRLSG